MYSEDTKRPNARDWFQVGGLIVAAVAGALIGAWAQSRLPASNGLSVLEETGALERELEAKAARIAELERQLAGGASATEAERLTSDASTAPASGCDSFLVDVQGGHLNGITPDVAQAELMEALPCFDGVDVGYRVKYESKGFIFHTSSNILEVDGSFVGTLSEQVLGVGRLELLRRWGLPYADDLDGALFPKPYGCMEVTYRDYSNENRSVVSVLVHPERCDLVPN